MSGNIWSDIIKIVSYVKKDCIDREQILLLLSHDMTYSLETLDSLYMRKIITLQEYIKFMDKLIEIEKENVKWISEYRKEAAEKGEDYQPSIHYGFNSPSYGDVIDIFKNSLNSFGENINQRSLKRNYVQTPSI